MEKLWIPFDIPNFKEVQKELSSFVNINQTGTKTHAFTVEQNQMIEKAPTFMEWFLPRNKMPVRIYRFYITEPKGRLHIHIDGFKDCKVPFGMNIPVKNCQNTEHIFYECAEENLRDANKNGYLGGCIPVDYNKIKKIGSLEITSPHFTRNDVMHTVRNNNDDYRIMFTVRWELHPTKARTIEEVFQL